MKFKNATAKEINSIMRTETLAFVKPLQESEETYLKRIETAKGTFLLFYTDFDEYMGYISAEFIEKVPETFQEIAFNHQPKENCKSEILYISSFALDRKFRGNGNGKEAFSLALKHFESNPRIKKIVLLVNEIWNGAKWIYTKAGFKETNCFEECFPPEDSNGKTAGILMEKTL